MNSLSKLKNVEDSWLIPLYTYCQRAFSHTHLPSHNEDHHLRVWITAKELIKQLNNQGVFLNSPDLTKVIIATFLHDTGMSITLDKTHGLESRKICVRFIEEYELNDLENLHELLDAIEKHDNKEYQNKFTGTVNPKHIFNILSVCDDLDAFGLTGVYRYAEIYLLRGIPIEYLATMVLKNLTNRVNYFTQSFGNLKNFHEKHMKRFDLTRSFFTDLKNQIINNRNTEGNSGPLGVINLINHFVINKKQTPVEAAKEIIRNTSDNYINTYFKGLITELCSIEFNYKTLL